MVGLDGVEDVCICSVNSEAAESDSASSGVIATGWILAMP